MLVLLAIFRVTRKASALKWQLRIPPNVIGHCRTKNAKMDTLHGRLSETRMTWQRKIITTSAFAIGVHDLPVLLRNLIINESD
jgi:hypothetical protein